MRAAMGERTTRSTSPGGGGVPQRIPEDDAPGDPPAWDDPDGALEARRRIEAFRDAAPEGNADSIWAKIQPQLSDHADGPPGASRPRRLLRRLARKARVTGGGWGGPVAVFLFAAAVILVLLAFQ